MEELYLYTKFVLYCYYLLQYGCWDVRIYSDFSKDLCESHLHSLSHFCMPIRCCFSLFLEFFSTKLSFQLLHLIRKIKRKIIGNMTWLSIICRVLFTNSPDSESARVASIVSSCPILLLKSIDSSISFNCCWTSHTYGNQRNCARFIAHLFLFL